jgi:hypothetical protein
VRRPDGHGQEIEPAAAPGRDPMARPVGSRSVQERAVPAPRELLAPVLCARIARARGLLMPTVGPTAPGGQLELLVDVARRRRGAPRPSRPRSASSAHRLTSQASLNSDPAADR